LEHIQDIDRNSLLYYQGVIAPKLQSLEKRRKQKLKILWYLRICLAFFWFGLIAFGINCIADDDVVKFIAIYAGILFSIVYFAI
jgi:hypothetical protein